MTGTGTPRVGVVGLGAMGALIASATVRAGLSVTVYDIRPDAVADLVAQGATGASSVEEVCKVVDVLSTVVVNEPQVRAVAEAMRDAAGDARTLVVHSTVTPGFVAGLAAELQPAGITVVDASVAGGLARARTGDLTVMVGGRDEDVARVRPVLVPIAREIFHCGPPGAGAATKLIVNFQTIAGYLLQVEGMQLAAAYGLDEDAVVTVLTSSNADSRGIRTWGSQDRMRRVALKPGMVAPQSMMRKDLSAAVTAAGEKGVVLPLAAVAASTVLDKLDTRDAALDERGGPADVPRCARCTMELAAPFREGGLHPECR